VCSQPAPGLGQIFSTQTFATEATLRGHEGEISKVCFTPQGTAVITAGVDCTCRVWSAQTGRCLQTLDGHREEIFSCAVNYEGNTILTGAALSAVSG
jgi:dynein assembly factor with WDR repeat domains 1